LAVFEWSRRSAITAGDAPPDRLECQGTALSARCRVDSFACPFRLHVQLLKGLRNAGTDGTGRVVLHRFRDTFIVKGFGEQRREGGSRPALAASARTCSACTSRTMPISPTSSRSLNSLRHFWCLCFMRGIDKTYFLEPSSRHEIARSQTLSSASCPGRGPRAPLRRQRT